MSFIFTSFEVMQENRLLMGHLHTALLSQTKISVIAFSKYTCSLNGIGMHFVGTYIHYFYKPIFDLKCGDF